MAAAPSYLVDTNILLRLSKKDDPNYLLVQAAIEALVMEGSELCFTPQNLIEFWNVCTRPASHNGFGLSVSETDRLARAIEGRIRLAVNKFLRRQGILRPDMIVVAGGAKTLASPRNDFERDFILEQVRMSMRLHQTARVFLMSHSDCATYGGLEAFDGDRKREAEHHQHELQRAAELVKANFPALTVRCFFVGFDGIHGADAHEIGQAA